MIHGTVSLLGSGSHICYLHYANRFRLLWSSSDS